MTRNKNILKLPVVILFVAAGTYIYWLLYRKPSYGIDDANIFFIYMRNFAQGHGFVFNVGGERVEGFTSFLYTLLGSIFFLFSAHPEIFLRLFNILLVSITLWQVIIFADKLFGDNRLFSPFAFFLLGAVILLPGYFDWTILSLMESGLWSCLLITSVITLCHFEFQDENYKRNNYLLAVLLMLLVLCRPESYLWGIAFLAIRFVQLRKLKSKSAVGLSLPNILMPLACFIIACSGITLWRLTYFGYPLPNTYYAKVSSDHLANFIEGLKYDYHFFRDNLFLLVVFILAVAYVVSSLKKTCEYQLKFPAWIIFAAIIVALAVPIYTGGDHFGQARFMQPIVPLFYLLFFIIIMEHTRFHSIKIKMYAAVVVSLLLILFSPRVNVMDYAAGKGGINIEFVIANEGRVLGNEMSELFSQVKPLPSVGLMASGARAYTYNGRSIDLWGLNTVSIAHATRIKSGYKNHAAFDKKIFYTMAPDIFIPLDFVQDTSYEAIKEKKPDMHNDWFLKVYKGIFNDEEFRGKYSLVLISKKNDSHYLFTYANNNFLSRLDETLYTCKIVNE